MKVSKEDAAGYEGQKWDASDKWAGYDAQGNWVGYGNETNAQSWQQDNTRWDSTLQKYVPVDTFDDVRIHYTK